MGLPATTVGIVEGIKEGVAEGMPEPGTAMIPVRNNNSVINIQKIIRFIVGEKGAIKFNKMK